MSEERPWQPAPGPGAMPVELSRDLVQSVLDELDLVTEVESGGILGYWDGCRIFFMLVGEQSDVFSTTVYLDRRFPIEQRRQVLELLDEWNRTRYWPKAFAETLDDGLVGVTGEAQLDCEPGISRDLLLFTVRRWIGTSLSLRDWVNDRMGVTGE